MPVAMVVYAMSAPTFSILLAFTLFPVDAVDITFDNIKDLKFWEPFAYNESALENHFHYYIEFFEKNYTADSETGLKKLEVFTEHLHEAINQSKKLVEQNASYWLGVNQFYDMNDSEFRSICCGLYRDATENSSFIDNETQTNPSQSQIRSTVIPSSWDYRDMGIVSGAKNQRSCGSCWAFAAIGSLEGIWVKATGRLRDLSEQQIIDCVRSIYKGNNDGCQGGDIYGAFVYATLNPLTNEAHYPYKEVDRKDCYYTENTGVAKMTKKFFADSLDTDDIKTNLLTYGPLPADLYSSVPTFKYYKGGVFELDNCVGAFGTDHAVLLVGFNYDDHGDYWIVKNSWGTGWGEQGFMKIRIKDGNKAKTCQVTETTWRVRI